MTSEKLNKLYVTTGLNSAYIFAGGLIAGLCIEASTTTEKIGLAGGAAVACAGGIAQLFSVEGNCRLDQENAHSSDALPESSASRTEQNVTDQYKPLWTDFPGQQ